MSASRGRISKGTAVGFKRTLLLLCVVARNRSEYGELISARFRSLPGVTSIESSFSLKAVKVFNFRGILDPF